MELIALGLFIILSCQLIFVSINLAYYPKLKLVKTPTKSSVKLSVLIPVRDEASNIQACLTSIVQQSLLPDEIIVLNDHSTDQTEHLVREMIKNYPLIKYKEGKPLPDGWLGKSFACHQLAREANGDWFLFLDADVRLESGALNTLAPYLSKQGSGIVSGFPRQIVRTWFERLVVPMMMFVILAHLPVWLVQRSPKPVFAAAHGGFIAISKGSYQKVGGHQAIRDTIVDDMALFKLIKCNQEPATLLKIDTLAFMRMYHDAKSVWSGYQKNIFVGVNERYPLIIIVLVYYLILYLGPFLLLIAGIDWIFAVLLIGLGILTKALADYSNGVNPFYSLFMPVSVLCVIFIAYSSVLTKKRGIGYQWKGRRYF
ncbi:Glycosyltransferase, catalytic subunit of cellulose synthase and poly-beta-1,6-N-acetylglucosamine synthase [Amphibacillus marinus]|uniref:4,4'-diaponeurosporenoate glycosyltransferase n=1 Tax=Amphibacillus marinus TaxID=872970 RepID=A0A1H8GQ61_9BACI|nr:glycosyltransferase family 2 protein [Amphibacillus marinus]SEN45418.1 Glycosyltransferase, catalytic subunit of cellulose synthase and poly-beta-1,6-N-acetylglucosamine synthase [Amphibacillus marinus]